jgi:hypothetical protein
VELVLDGDGRKELDRLWDEFDFIADHTARTWAQFYFNQSGAVDGKDPEAGRPRPVDKALDHPDVIFGLRDDYRAKAAADPGNDPVAVQAVEYHFAWINDTLRRVQKMRLDAEPATCRPCSASPRAPTGGRCPRTSARISSRTTAACGRRTACHTKTPFATWWSAC